MNAKVEMVPDSVHNQIVTNTQESFGFEFFSALDLEYVVL